MNLFFNKKEHRPRAGWRLTVQFILFIFLTGLSSLVFYMLWQSSLSIASAIPQFIGTLASIWLAARILDKRSFTAYGFTITRRWWIDFGAGSGLGFLSIAIIFFIEWQAGWLSVTGFGWKSPGDYAFPVALISSFGAMLLVGFYEELLSRGYQLLNLSEGLRYPQIGGTRGAIVIATLLTSTLFGVMHAFNPNASSMAIFNIVLAGIVLAVPYILTGSLGLSVGLHFSWNFVQGAVFGFPVSGIQLDTSIIRIAQEGPEHWTGGAFGPEAGSIGILGMAIMLAGTLGYIHTSKYKLAIAGLFRDSYQTRESDE